jgi:hypothetical protein
MLCQKENGQAKNAEKIFPINIRTTKRTVFKMPIILLRGNYGHFSILICTV